MTRFATVELLTQQWVRSHTVTRGERTNPQGAPEDCQGIAAPPVAAEPHGRHARGVQQHHRSAEPARRDHQRSAAGARGAVQADRADAVGAGRSAARVGENAARRHRRLSRRIIGYWPQIVPAGKSVMQWLPVQVFEGRFSSCASCSTLLLMWLPSNVFPDEVPRFRIPSRPLPATWFPETRLLSEFLTPMPSRPLPSTRLSSTVSPLVL